MDDNEFLDKIKDKIEKLSGVAIRLDLDREDQSALRVEREGPTPTVVVGSHVLEYSGFARMATEYAVACLRAGRDLDQLEFQILLARN